MKQNKKRTPCLPALSVLILAILAFITVIYNLNKFHVANVDREIEKRKLEFEVKRAQRQLLYDQIDIIDMYVEVAEKATKRDVYITSYGKWDKQSGDTTATGKAIKDFELNAEGMYTFDGKVVLGTANTTEWDRPLRDGYVAHEFNDTIVFDYLGKTYTGIVLDLCGACQGWEEETIQRIDIFTESKSLGKKVGTVYE